MAFLINRSSAEDGFFEPGEHIVTETNLNPILQMSTWLLLGLTTLMFCFRLLTRFFLRSNNVLGVEEALALSAYLLSLGQSVTVIIPEGGIFGRTLADISADELTAGMRAAYAGDLLFILSLGCGKLTLCACLLTLSPDRMHRRMVYLLGSVVVLWTLSALLGSALRCGGQLPWLAKTEQCFNLRAFLEYQSIANILTDAALVALPVVMIYPLNLSLKSRATVLMFFASRALVIIPTVFQLIYLPRLFEADFTLRAFPYYLSVQLVQFASVSATCLVYFWPLMNSLRSGLMWADNIESRMSSSRLGMSKFSNKSRGTGGAATATIHSVAGSDTPSRRNYIKITTGYAVSSGSLPIQDGKTSPTRPEPSGSGNGA
ncbi:hypothetical protein N656DRAFT_849605 [Canariomyces notabilis]|uniref:Rhodopsin domain-containing protein n=1 Tax=Canariomyces notabilis TaxID=2074819 RepID=A0AAN6QED5_9PEZI|nr:hypothetical protein N656DRAFT_849605 [Canariomyces arenarius]